MMIMMMIMIMIMIMIMVMLSRTVMMGLDLLVSDLDEDFDAFAIPPTCRMFSSRQMSAKFLHPKSVSSKQMSNSSLSDAGSRHCETVRLSHTLFATLKIMSPL
jgi:hypothetical protein